MVRKWWNRKCGPAFWKGSLSAAALLAVVSGGAGTGRRGTAAAPLPGRQQAQKGAYTRREVVLTQTGVPAKVRIYLPNRPAQQKLPCVLIAPAGSRLYHGMALSEGDTAEHLPYVHAGYIVIAYEIDGNLSDDFSAQQMRAAMQAFKNADAGVANAKAALDYALANVPNIDPARIYTAGHNSSAGTLSLLVAAREPRIKGCVAYAPRCDVPAHLKEGGLTLLDQVLPGFSAFIRRDSPHNNIATLHCPVFLFHADDDTTIPTKDVADFATALKRAGKEVTFARVPTGEHYASMIQKGIPQAMEWLHRLPTRQAAK